MSVEQRKSERIIDYLPIEVHTVDTTDGQLIAGPFSGSIIDLSRHGACLLMTQVFHNGFHLFYSTRDTSNAVLQITINHPPDINNCILTAVPIWMDLFRQNEIRAFKMGIEFTGNPEMNQMKKLRKALQKKQGQRAEWWMRHCKNWLKNS
jgi:hypothetical protein